LYKSGLRIELESAVHVHSPKTVQADRYDHLSLCPTGIILILL